MSFCISVTNRTVKEMSEINVHPCHDQRVFGDFGVCDRFIDNVFDQVIVRQFPDIMGDHEDDCLQHENPRDPYVVQCGEFVSIFGLKQKRSQISHYIHVIVINHHTST